MKRWIPKVGEVVTLAGDGHDIDKWVGRVEKVTKAGCDKGRVYLDIEGHGPTYAASHEITIHK